MNDFVSECKTMKGGELITIRKEVYLPKSTEA
jgi:hypothetical protein